MGSEAHEASTRTISTWRGLLFRSAYAAVVVIVVVQLLGRQVIPPLVVGAVLLVVGLIWLRRPGRAPVMFLAIVSALFLLTNLPFALPSLGHPESAFDFVSVGAILVSLMVTAGVALTVLRSRSAPTTAPRVVGLASFGLVVLMGIVGAIAASATKSDDGVAGDLALGAKAVKWTTATLAAKPGTVAILIDNADATRHDFTIKKVVSADLPERKARRVTFDAKPGSYKYYCTIHPAMKGTLTVR
jgi:plastocyanin